MRNRRTNSETCEVYKLKYETDKFSRNIKRYFFVVEEEKENRKNKIFSR